jgi:L-alanine-DL-glutamate epimerase-like enolase superfamily enzyme
MARIVGVETFFAGDVALVRVRTEDGQEGWGQVAPYHADITALVLHRQVAPHVLGQDDGDLTALGERVMEREHKFPGSHLVRALGGVDTALWDLQGKRAGRPVCELIGGSVRSLAVYASSMRRDIEPAEEAARLAALQDRHGYRAVKFRIGRECGNDRDEWPGRTEAVVPAVRQAVAEGTALLVDANSCYTPAEAIEVGRMLQDEGVRHFEEPCPYWERAWPAHPASSRSTSPRKSSAWRADSARPMSSTRRRRIRPRRSTGSWAGWTTPSRLRAGSRRSSTRGRLSTWAARPSSSGSCLSGPR